jgi:ankyrin repeat protein
MTANTAIRGLLATVCAGVLASAMVVAQAKAPVADAAMARDAEAVRKLIKDGAEINAAQGDGMTALHWAAMRGDAEMAATLLYAGASTRATTRLNNYTPLHLAAQAGHLAVIEALLKGGANASAATSNGTTPLMLAAASGNAAAVKLLVGKGADLNAVETNGQTALMFAAANDRPDVVKALVDAGADVKIASKVNDLAGLTAPEEDIQQQTNTNRPAVPQTGPKPPKDVPGATRAFTYNELIGHHGGLTALLFAARQGSMESVQTLVKGGADVNQVGGDRTSPLLMAVINGHYDMAAWLLDQGADPNLSSEAGVTPLYGVVNLEWAPRSFYPQPRAQLQQKTTYLQLMTRLLDKGADPNARVNRQVWFTQYNFDLLRTNETGATPFWKAAYASDIEGMKLLVSRGADPNIPTAKPARSRGFQGGTRSGDDSRDGSGLPPVPVGAPGIPPLLAAAGAGFGEGFAGNAHRSAPTGMLAAVKFLVEELGADVNAVDHEGMTALHNAASRGDNEMIEYLVSKGADPKKVNRQGQTTVDMANGPVQRTQPYPETIKLLESLGAVNNHKCVSC